MKLTTSVLAVSLCLLIAFVLAGCDTTAIAPTGEAPESTDPATETVTFNLMKSGDTLEDPSQFTEDVESAKHDGRMGTLEIRKSFGFDTELYAVSTRELV